MLWEEYSIESIVAGRSSDGVSYLKMFLSDYSKLTGIETLNAGCSLCLIDYLKDYKTLKNITKMENSNYKLKAKYENLPLRNDGEGYNVNVNNNNLTDEYAVILLERFEADRIFEVYPATEIKVVEPKVVEPKNKK
jgi:hypothetical protein